MIIENTNSNYTFDKTTEFKILIRYVPSDVVLALGYTEDEMRELGFEEARIQEISRMRAEFDAKQAAHEAAEAHLASEVEKGKALLARLPSEPTHGDLRFVMEGDREALYKSAGVEL